MPKPATDFDVFVAGGGPAGLAAAIAARQRGLSALVVDILHPPVDKACGEGLMPDSQNELARLGISLSNCEQAPFRGIRFVGPRSSVQADFPRGAGVGIRRTVLHSALIAHAEKAGVEMHWGVRVSGIRPGAALLDGRIIRARWIIGADGQNSLVRNWARLNEGREFERRIALRQHFRVPQIPEFVEIHWGEDRQAYVTPVGRNEVCVAVISKRRLPSFEDGLGALPCLAAWLREGRPTSAVRGAVTVSNRLRRVYRDRIALVGDASGSVDAITGEGLALGFRQALALGEALAADDLSLYQSAHDQIEWLPQFMRRTMLLMDKSARLRERAFAAFHASPGLFSRMLAVHVGELSLGRFGISSATKLGWQMLTA